MIAERVVEALHIDASLLADEARAEFERLSEMEVSPLWRVRISCESLKVTTRLMHIMSWVMTWQQGQHPAPLPPGGDAPAYLDDLPEPIAACVRQSLELYARLERLANQATSESPPASPALLLQQKLQTSL